MPVGSRALGGINSVCAHASLKVVVPDYDVLS